MFWQCCRDLANWWRHLAWLLPLCVWLAASPGCGGPQRELGRIDGRLTFGGNPVGDAVMLFRNDEQGVHMTARVDETGRFRVVMAEGEGLPPGTYHAAVLPPRVEYMTGDPPPQIPERPDIPERYRDTATSGLTMHIHAGTNPVEISMVP